MLSKNTPNKKTAKDKYKPPSIPDELIKTHDFEKKEIEILKHILDPLKKGATRNIESKICDDLINKVAKHYNVDSKVENTFLYQLTYAFLLFLSTVQEPKNYFDTYTFLIQREDVQKMIFRNPDNLYKCYAIIFNDISQINGMKNPNEIKNEDDFEIEFIKVADSIDFEPDLNVFWNKFYYFLYYNCIENPPKKFQVSTYRGEQYLNDISEKLVFFFLMGFKAYYKPRNYICIHDLIFQCIINHNIRSFNFYTIWINSNDYEGAIDSLIKYINQNIIMRSEKPTKTKDTSLYDANFGPNLYMLLEPILNSYKQYTKKVIDYFHYLARACIPLISNNKITTDIYAEKIDQQIMFIVSILKSKKQAKFLCSLLQCKKPTNDYHLFKNKNHSFDPSLGPSLDVGIDFLKKSKEKILPESFEILFEDLFSNIGDVKLENLKLVIKTYLEMYPNERSSFVSNLSEFWESPKWQRKYNMAIQDKTKSISEAGRALNEYLISIQSQEQYVPSSSPQKEISLPLKVNDSNDSVDSSGNLSSSSSVTYTLTFLNKKENNKFQVTFDKKVTVKHAIRRIAQIGIFGHDEEDNGQAQPEQQSTQNNSNEVQVEEGDLDEEDDDSLYHTMQRGRASFFCKEGMLFGHEKISSDKSHREPIEIFGLSNYVDRSLPFNSLSFPNNNLFVRLVPIKLLRMSDSYSAPKLVIQKNINEEKIEKTKFDNESVFDHITVEELNKLAMISSQTVTPEDATFFLQNNKDYGLYTQHKQNQRREREAQKSKEDEKPSSGKPSSIKPSRSKRAPALKT